MDLHENFRITIFIDVILQSFCAIKKDASAGGSAVF